MELRSKGFFAACLYGFVSISITFFNKGVFSIYHFDFAMLMTLAQMILSIVFLLVMRRLKLVDFPDFQWQTAKSILPLSFCFYAMVTTGLAALKVLNVPMFNALRRITTLITLKLELYMLGRTVSLPVEQSVWLQLAGAVVAAMYDWTFDLWGYILVLINCAVTAGYLVWIAKLGHVSNLNSFGQMFYNNVLALPWVFITAWLNGELAAVSSFPYLWSFKFHVFFIISCSQAFLLNYAIFLCTNVNSALTTSVVGQLKNILTTVVGLFLFGDVVFDTMNLLGLAIGTFASIWYSHIRYQESQRVNKDFIPSVKPELLLDLKSTVKTI
eukprot:GILK01006884.1.p1 GENE.GILK01006884.1~~GILK01006884.1.p1  ORF type:complete len:327 (+),score=37.19 GILK01006884.1:52-1032(+)